MDDAGLRAALHACAAAQRAAVAGRALDVDPARAAAATSPAALDEARLGGDVSDVRTADGLGHCFVFNAAGLPGSVADAAVEAAKARLDAVVGDLLGDLPGGAGRRAVSSGLFLYPPGGWMGWHTNSRVPGRRLYLSVVDEPARSWFRYLDEESRELFTSWDSGTDLRVFDIDPERRFWHAVWSDTHRCSVGYRLLPVDGDDG
ncbi:MAG: hypothetical protein MUF83_11430 [Acidimicrobiales bacterium]|nr:hypothetical protein [Acidimicrobiales bacterium]